MIPVQWILHTIQNHLSRCHLRPNVPFCPYSLLDRSLLSCFWLSSAAMPVFFRVVPIILHCCPCIWYFHCLRHRNKFLHHIVVTQWIYPFSCNVIFVILVRRSFHAFPRRFIGFNNTSAFCLVFLNCATSFPDLITLKCVRHCGWRYPWIPYNQDQWKKYHAIFWRCRALVSR